MLEVSEMTKQQVSQKYERRIHVGYAAIAGFAVIAVLATEVWPRGNLLGRYGPNLVAEALGILVTLVFVERILVWQRDRALAPVRAVALRRMRIHLNRLMHMVLFSYKAAAPPGSPEEVEPSGLLSAWAREARWLDFRKPYGPDGPARPWHQYASEVVSDFEDGTSALLDR